MKAVRETKAWCHSPVISITRDRCQQHKLMSLQICVYYNSVSDCVPFNLLRHRRVENCSTVRWKLWIDILGTSTSASRCESKSRFDDFEEQTSFAEEDKERVESVRFCWFFDCHCREVHVDVKSPEIPRFLVHLALTKSSAEWRTRFHSWTSLSPLYSSHFRTLFTSTACDRGSPRHRRRWVLLDRHSDIELSWVTQRSFFGSHESSS